jgi:hypothetical protein
MKAIAGTLRLTLALQTIGPVVWTELGQYCCNSTPAPKQQCNDHLKILSIKLTKTSYING